MRVLPFPLAIGAGPCGPGGVAAPPAGGERKESPPVVSRARPAEATPQRRTFFTPVQPRRKSAVVEDEDAPAGYGLGGARRLFGARAATGKGHQSRLFG